MMTCLVEIGNSDEWHRNTVITGLCLIIKTVFPRCGIPMLKIKGSQDHVIFKIGIPILVRWYLYIETAPRSFGSMAWCCKVNSHYLNQCWPSFLMHYCITRGYLEWIHTSQAKWSPFGKHFQALFLERKFQFLIQISSKLVHTNWWVRICLLFSGIGRGNKQLSS